MLCNHSSFNNILTFKINTINMFQSVDKDVTTIKILLVSIFYSFDVKNVNATFKYLT